MLGNLVRKIFIWTLVASLSGLPLTAAADQEVIGKVASSSGASLRGIAIPGEGTILSGDTLSTNKGGGALVELSPTVRASLSEETSVRLQNVGGHLSAQMSSGTLVTETSGKDALVVETPKYKINPVEQGKSVYVVAMLPDKSTVIAAPSGQVSITEISSSRSYLLSEGQYVQIPGLSSGVPGQGGGKVEADPSPTRILDPLWHIGSLSHKASIILVTAIAGGTAAAIAIPLALRGGPASPSKP